jgi:RNA polymerase sigma-70 factor (ECF subfamily)
MMSHALRPAPGNEVTHEDGTHPGCLEVCEVTGERLFRAGEYAAPGEYVESETGRRLILASPDFLPARLDGRVACYRLMRRGQRETEEQRLLQRQAQFQRLAAKMYPRLYNFARRTRGNLQDAEDITQETLARAWTHFESFDPSRSFEAWVFRIAGNLIIDQSRRRKHHQEISLDAPVAFQEGDEEVSRPELADHTRDPENCLMAKEVSAELQSALLSLPSLHQTTLLLVAQQRSYEQIARAFDCPVGTVRSRVYRARVMLRRNLKLSTFLKDIPEREEIL